MPVTVVELENKTYKIDGSDFKLKKPTLGIKRTGVILANSVGLQIQILATLSNKYQSEAKKVKASDVDGLRILSEKVGELNKTSEELFVKSEEFLKVVLEPVKLGDIDKLVADNLDEVVIAEVVQDFFQLAGLSIKPAKD